jgi:NADH-quinone oxidoreductase subunit C
MQVDQLKLLLRDDAQDIESRLGELTAVVEPQNLSRVLFLLRDHSKFLFKQLIDVCAVDYPSRPCRFEVVYHLLSLHHNDRLRIKVRLKEGDSIPTCTPIFPSAGWWEREVWDMMGIVFSGHPDLRRILTDYGFEGHPLRKDFPLTGFTEVRYDEERKAVVYEPVNLQQGFRNFDFESPWRGSEAMHAHVQEQLNAESDSSS